MAVKDIATQCFILALFERDDKQRLLLGSGAYMFKSSQQHFAANAFSNDIVEIQGNDGALLAGQVRRATTQVFDGYIGDATNDKSTIEKLRKDFIMFFRKNHYYKVIYIFPDGTSIQRIKGYIVDAPEVKELYQHTPEYHIGLNFEDVNYYAYDENDEGQEIYGKSAIIPNSRYVSGGLVWDENGVVWANADSIISNLQGDIVQATYSGKNLAKFIPRDVSTLDVSYDSNTGEITLDGTYNGWIRIGDLSTVNYEAGTFTLSINEAKNYLVNMRLYTSETAFTSATIQRGDTSVSVTTSYPVIQVAVYVYLSSSTTYNDSFYLQLERGDTATAFEKYVGGVSSPNPGYPQTVSTATGPQTVSITTDGITNNFNLELGTMSLCQIGDTKDYIYKDNDKFYVHREVGHYSINEPIVDGISGSASGPSLISNTGAFALLYSDNNINIPAGELVSNFLTYQTQTITSNAQASSMIDGSCVQRSGTNDRLYFRDSNYTGYTGEQMSDIVQNLEIYYQLDLPTDTEITNSTLIGQLEDIYEADLDASSIITVSGDEPIIVNVDNIGGGGATWEEGGGGGGNIVNVDSVDNVYPIWTVTGESENPVLENVTTGTTIRYSGTITATQVLVIDMRNKTATLNGTSVIGNVYGDWVYFAPGNNRIEYSTDNANAPESKIEWNEVVG